MVGTTAQAGEGVPENRGQKNLKQVSKFVRPSAGPKNTVNPNKKLGVGGCAPPRPTIAHRGSSPIK